MENNNPFKRCHSVLILKNCYLKKSQNFKSSLNFFYKISKKVHEFLPKPLDKSFSCFLYLYHQWDIIRKRNFVFVFIPHSSSELSTYLKSSERKSIPFCFTSIECTIIKCTYLHMAIIWSKNVTKWIQKHSE